MSEGGGERGCTWEIKGLQNRLNITMGKGEWAGSPGSVSGKTSEWPFDCFLVCFCFLNFWHESSFFFLFFILSHIFRPTALLSVAKFTLHEITVRYPAGSVESDSRLACQHL